MDTLEHDIFWLSEQIADSRDKLEGFKLCLEDSIYSGTDEIDIPEWICHCEKIEAEIKRDLAILKIYCDAFAAGKRNSIVFERDMLKSQHG